jgi:GNAT superfamily N-acetyltransferase
MTTINTTPSQPPTTSAGSPVRKATPGDERAVTEVLRRAFDDDPVINWFLRQDADRAEAFRRFFQVSVGRMAMPHDEVHTTTPATRGAALWFPPGTWQLGDDDVEALLPDLERCFGGKLERSLEGMATITAHHPQEPHWYLLFLGVDPTLHNRGIGSTLLSSMLRRCDARGLPAYLEASSPRNVPLYERHGFVVTETLTLPDGPPLWPMWREPRSAGSRA